MLSKLEIEDWQELYDLKLDSQSGITEDAEVERTITEASDGQEEIVVFKDQEPGFETRIDGGYEETMSMVGSSDSTLAGFLQRPIRESVTEWGVNFPLTYNFNPWTAFLENPYVYDKIKNYELIRMKLKVKFVISGTKFHYGRVLVAYDPLAAYNQFNEPRGLVDQDRILLSQKPHTFLNPANNMGSTLELPFFWRKNYLSLTRKEYTEMGKIYMYSFGNLLHANEGVDPATVTVYIWAEDVELCMPTSNETLLSQSGKGKGNKNKGKNNNKKKPPPSTINMSSSDEYGSGIISKPAAVVAQAAGVLAQIPMIAPYARATEMVVGKLGQVAKIFGYSRPNVITDVQLFKPSPTGNLANVDAADAALKLTMDSKAELTIDSRTVGLAGKDEMEINSIVQRESYLTFFEWDPTDNPDDLLFNIAVTPRQIGALNEEIHPTPMAMIAQCFEAWQGTIKFRFQVIRSDFHKGRILVRYDPVQNSPSVEYNTNYSRVIDIADGDDFEICVGWAQAEAWLETGAMENPKFSDSNRLSKNVIEDNGILELNVLNTLVSPGASTPVRVNVYVSMCEDAKFAGPTSRKLNDMHYFAPPEAPPGLLESQSGMAPEGSGMTDTPTGAETLEVIGQEGDLADNYYSVFYGDPPTSIRELMKRYTRHRTVVYPFSGVDRIRRAFYVTKDAPAFSGFDPEGFDTAQDGTTNINCVQPTFATWFQPLYAGWRGSRRKKYMFTNAGDLVPSVARRTFVATGNGSVVTQDQDLVEADTPRYTKWLSTSDTTGTGGGAATTNCSVNNTIEVELPYYRNERFSSARYIRNNSQQCNSHHVELLYGNTADVQSGFGLDKIPIVQQWDAVGEDYSLFFFTGCPIMYKYVVREFT